MKIKVLSLIILMICLSVCITGCKWWKNNDSDVSDDLTINQSQTNQNSNSGENGNDDLTIPTILSIEKGYIDYKAESEVFETTLLDYKNTYLILAEEDMINYPELAKVISKDAEKIKSDSDSEKAEMEQTALNLCLNDKELFETFKIYRDLQVRRADSTVLSVVSDEYYNYPEMKNVRILNGINYDTKSGKIIKISDVVKDMNKFQGLVALGLINSSLNTDLDLESAVAEYFSNTSEENISWTLDYNGITIYFSNSDLEESSSEVQSVTVSFEENKDLFVRKYMNVPESYIVELGFKNTFYTNLDENNLLEELTLNSFYSDEKNMYETFGVYTNIDAVHYSKDIDAYNYRPFFVKDNDRNLLYVFSETKEKGFRDMKLSVINVDNRNFVHIADMNVGMRYMLSNLFTIPTNPNKILLDNFESLEQDMRPYYVGQDGMPEIYEIISVIEKETVEVSSVEEFINAIRPNVKIIIKPGYYNLSEYLEEAWKNEGEIWNEEHKYLNIEERFDGVDLTIKNVENITISGGSVNPKDTHIVITPRYGTILSFDGCQNLTLANFMAGHTDTGTCKGNVINLYSCRNVQFNNLDLYGCGDYGIGAFEQTEGISGTRIMVRDCSSGPLEFTSCKGNIEFYDCTFKDSDGFANVEASTIIKFYDCEFGNKETTVFRFSGNFMTENCIWDDNAMYPEF